MFSFVLLYFKLCLFVESNYLPDYISIISRYKLISVYSLVNIHFRVFHKVYDSFAPDAIVLQCGADALAGDPLGGGGLTIKGYCNCVQNVLHKNKPTVLLGGGRYI